MNKEVHDDEVIFIDKDTLTDEEMLEADEYEGEGTEDE